MIKRLSLLFLFLGFYCQSLATHIVGGDFTYKWISGNTFEISLTLFRDCNGVAPFDDSITVGIFDGLNNSLAYSVTIGLTSTSSLQLAGTLCSPPPEICVESGSYVKNILLANNPFGYYMTWERCCRNHTVVNLNNPGATGMVFYAAMPDPAWHNSSPVFQNDPLPYMCENQPFLYNFGGFDADGDSLVYELVTPSSGNSSQASPILSFPLPGPYSDAQFQSPYSLGNICGGPPLAVDPATGDITAKPDYIGIYAMAVVAREYRNGVQIGIIRREIEFTVIICDINVAPSVTSYSTGLAPGTKSFELFETDSICFQVSGSDATDSLFLTYSGDCFAGSGINPPFAQASNGAGDKQVSAAFCWQTACGHGRTAPYEVTFEIRDNGCPNPITTQYKMNILVKPVPLIPPLNLLCMSFDGDDTAIIYWSDTSANDKFLSCYLLFRSENGGPYTLLDTIYDKSAGKYRDVTAFGYKQHNYCYFIRSFNICGDAGLNSDTLCTDKAKNDTPNYIESVSVTGHEKVQMKLEHLPDGPYSTFYIYRKINSPLETFSLYQTEQGIQNDSWEDQDVKTRENSYCYYVMNQDYCGNISPPSREACTILLTGSSVPFLNSIHWTEYINWRGGVFDYEIYRKTDEQVNFSKLTQVEYVVFDLDDDDLDYDHGLYTYRVRATEGPGGNGAESYSNEVDLVQPPLVFTPNAFTPNNDQANENWGVSSIFIKDYNLRIFNRYGQVIFSSSDKHASWDGTFHGQEAPQGVYVYDLRYNSFYSAKESRKTGTITLLR